MPAKKRVILHIGLHKTGTTSIQVALKSSRPKLRTVGILYPVAGTPHWIPAGHHLLPWSLLGEFSMLEQAGQSHITLWRALHEEIEATPAKTVILSSEEFDRLQSKEIAKLRQQLLPYPVTPVLFLRNFSDFIESAYMESVLHHGFTGSIYEYSKIAPTRLDYCDLIRDWHAISDDGKIVVLSYDDIAVRRDSVAAFMQAIDLQPHFLKRQQTHYKNASPPAFVCELVRYLRTEQKPEPEIKEWLRCVRKHRFSPTAKSRYTVMPTRLRMELDGRYASEIRELSSDPQIAPFIQGRLDCEGRTDAKMISGLSDAIAAFGSELFVPRDDGFGRKFESIIRLPWKKPRLD
jgi:hypothetical protein